MNDRVFKRNFRMSKSTFEVLFQTIVLCLPPGLSPNKKSIHPRERLLIFLAFVGGNMFGEFASYAHNMAYGKLLICYAQQSCFSFHYEPKKRPKSVAFPIRFFTVYKIMILPGFFLSYCFFLQENAFVLTHSPTHIVFYGPRKLIII